MKIKIPPPPTPLLVWAFFSFNLFFLGPAWTFFAMTWLLGWMAVDVWCWHRFHTEMRDAVIKAHNQLRPEEPLPRDIQVTIFGPMGEPTPGDGIAIYLMWRKKGQQMLEDITRRHYPD